jgi:hypothetical protein
VVDEEHVVDEEADEHNAMGARLNVEAWCRLTLSKALSKKNRVAVRMPDSARLLQTHLSLDAACNDAAAWRSVKSGRVAFWKLEEYVLVFG